MPNIVLRETIASTVRAEVARRSVAQATIGAELGLTQAAVSRRIRGDVEWTASEVVTLSSLLEVTTDVLLGVASLQAEATA